MSELSEAHKTDILKAAIAVFGREGYEAATTKEIAKQANVSKGLLFHHFTNKEKLYITCQQYVLEQYGQFMANRLDFTITDFFDRVIYAMRIKMDFGCENPSFLALINRAWTVERDENPLQRPEAEAHVLESMQVKNEDSFFEGIDTSLFREGMDLAKAIDYTRLAIEAAWNRFMQRHNNDTEAMIQNMEVFFTEAEEIVGLLKYGAYQM